MIFEYSLIGHKSLNKQDKELAMGHRNAVNGNEITASITTFKKCACLFHCIGHAGIAVL